MTAVEISTLAAVRATLPSILRAFRSDPQAAPLAFGRHGRAEAVILSSELYDRLLRTARDYEDCREAPELLRRMRHPLGPTIVALTALPFGSEGVDGGPGPAADSPPVRAWPGVADDLLRLRDQQPAHLVAGVAAAVDELARERRAGLPLATSPGQERLAGLRRLRLGTDPPHSVFYLPLPPESGPRVELVAVLARDPDAVLLDLAAEPAPEAARASAH